MGELAAGMQAHGEAGAFDLVLRLLAERGQLVQRHTGEVRALDVRRAGHVAHALGVQAAGVGQGILHRLRPVIDAGQEVAVQICV